jgi:5'-nucleotidase
VARIDVTKRPGRPAERFYGSSRSRVRCPTTETAEVVNAYESKLGAGLDEVVGTSRTPLEGTSPRLRASETNLGDLVADAVRDVARSEIALVNGGGVRGDRVHQPGPLTRRTLIEIHPFGNVVCTLSVPGKVVVAALEHGVSRLPAAAGQFPQVSGLTFRVNPEAPTGSRVTDVRVQNAPIDLNRTYTLAVPDFLLAGGDGYTMFKGQKVLVGPEAGPTLAAALERYVAERRGRARGRGADCEPINALLMLARPRGPAAR